ncbi:hypothetical protein ASPZODRAFT_255140 [Penicilliopsis zonata CBS 506.65]|uniref:Cutinase n=1 Tax=Penicilliopsis zonata CBS 506.65 TaxID=1073090 RepID=A0A1L9SUG6_9EURO|nr:hypothetical protein ASPZODRAFT_255140 [Penicilliopsis zonata CBS 506.65]OJJ50761.1 hypothetical protein ASPZODRAFT_255140 [Penicilliopsis zonata CBS 506.65]
MHILGWTSFLALGAISMASTVTSNTIVQRETALNEFLAILLEYLPDIDGDITDVTDTIADFEELLADLLDITTTYNELGQTCTDYTIIFARGTSEPGNVGVLVGPPLFIALEDLIGSSALTIQGVNDYAASVEGYLEGGSAVASAEMASQIESAVSDCPDTKLIVSGYSQGCQVVHNAINSLSATTAAYISSVLLFGDPDDGQALSNVASSKVDTFCHVDDDICDDGVLILPAHLTYAENVAAAAAFAVAAAKR